jgi:hypothetical protein
MNYAFEMGRGVKIHLPSFIKIGSAIQKLVRGALKDIQTHKDRSII